MRGEMERRMAYRDIMRELKEFQARGISLELNGRASGPESIVRAHRICESKGTYNIMRDYIFDEEGKRIEEVHFEYVKNPPKE